MMSSSRSTKIAAIGTTLLRLPFRHGGPPLQFAGRPRTAIEMLLVRVDTEDGFTGWGEAFGPGVWPATQAVIDHLLAPLCIGRDAEDIEVLGEDLQRKLHQLGRGGPVAFALSGIDIALWDIRGQRAGLPVCRLLKGSPATRLEAYASLFRYADARLVASKCEEAAAKGYRHVKLHETGVDQARAARRALGADAGLMMDVNCPWNASQAIDMCQRLSDLGLRWLEEPVWPPEDHAALARVRREGGLPVAAGENAASPTEFRELLDARAVDFVQPSAIKIGGLTALLSVMDAAKQAGVAVMPHSPYFGPGLLATMHACAARAPDALIEIYFCDLDASPLGSAISPQRGWLAVPEGPGLGAAPDPAVLKEFSAKPG